MNEKIIMLGTGSAMVTDCYNACFLLKSENYCLLVDAGGGNGILSAIKKSGVAWNSIKTMFITHSHTDHILGAVWVIRQISALMNSGKYDGNFNILKNINTKIFINEVKDGEKQNVGSIRLTFFDIFSDKTKQFGFKAVFPSGKVLTCLGDEPFNEKCRNFVQNCDYLMCEAFCLYSQKDIFKPYEKFHSTALDAGKLAESLFAKNLILYHTEDETLQTRKSTYTSEARTVFNGNIFVPDDFEVIDLK